MPKYDWKSVNWQKSTMDISKELGCSLTQVSRARKEYAPETLQPYKMLHDRHATKYAWDTVDWNKTTREISNELGCSYCHASMMIHKIGFPRKTVNTMISVRVTDALYAELQKQAFERGCKQATFVREIIRQFLEGSNV